MGGVDYCDGKSYRIVGDDRPIEQLEFTHDGRQLVFIKGAVQTNSEIPDRQIYVIDVSEAD